MASIYSVSYLFMTFIMSFCCCACGVQLNCWTILLPHKLVIFSMALPARVGRNSVSFVAAKKCWMQVVVFNAKFIYLYQEKKKKEK